jgi:hypothetical protein
MEKLCRQPLSMHGVLALVLCPNCHEGRGNGDVVQREAAVDGSMVVYCVKCLPTSKVTIFSWIFQHTTITTIRTYTRTRAPEPLPPLPACAKETKRNTNAASRSFKCMSTTVYLSQIQVQSMSPCHAPLRISKLMSSRFTFFVPR